MSSITLHLYSFFGLSIGFADENRGNSIVSSLPVQNKLNFILGSLPLSKEHTRFFKKALGLLTLPWLLHPQQSLFSTFQSRKNFYTF